MCLSSTRTNDGITMSPSIKPVFKISTILPSIMTLVSRIFGAAPVRPFVLRFALCCSLGTEEAWRNLKSGLNFLASITPKDPKAK